MSSHNLCFHGEIRKIFLWIPRLPEAMVKDRDRSSDKTITYFTAAEIAPVLENFLVTHTTGQYK